MKSKDREVPLASAAPPPFDTNSNQSRRRKSSSAVLRLPSRARPGLAADVARLQRRHRDLQRRFKQLPPGNPHVRKSKLRAAVARIAQNEYAPPPAQRRRIPEPLPTSANRRLLASRSAPRGKANLIPPPPPSSISQNNRGYSTKIQIFVPSKNSDEKAKPAAEASLGAWATPGEEEVIFKQAASAHRMRRLRAWSQTHQQQEGEGAEEKVVDSPAVAVAVSKDREKIKKEQAAWSILADLQMETLDKQRQSSKAGGSTSGKLAGERKMTPAAAHRRRTEQQQKSTKSDIPAR